MSLSLSLYLSLSLSLCLYISLSLYLSLPVSLSLCLSLCLYQCSVVDPLVKLWLMNGSEEMFFLLRLPTLIHILKCGLVVYIVGNRTS